MAVAVGIDTAGAATGTAGGLTAAGALTVAVFIGVTPAGTALTATGTASRTSWAGGTGRAGVIPAVLRAAGGHYASAAVVAAAGTTAKQAAILIVTAAVRAAGSAPTGAAGVAAAIAAAAAVTAATFGGCRLDGAIDVWNDALLWPRLYIGGLGFRDGDGLPVSIGFLRHRSSAFLTAGAGVFRRLHRFKVLWVVGALLLFVVAGIGFYLGGGVLLAQQFFTALVFGALVEPVFVAVVFNAVVHAQQQVFDAARSFPGRQTAPAVRLGGKCQGGPCKKVKHNTLTFVI